MKRSDEYWAQRAKKEGYRSRASYKLLQLDEKYNLITKSSLIFDLGCAPGGWSQVIAEKINVSAKCIAIDILNMQRVDKVEFHQIDLFSNEFKDMMKRYRVVNLGDGENSVVQKTLTIEETSRGMFYRPDPKLFE